MGKSTFILSNNALNKQWIKLMVCQECLSTSEKLLLLLQVNLELTHVKRQSDSRFVEILKSLRNGRCSKEEAAVLRATALNEDIDRDGEIVASKLCTHSEDVDHINRCTVTYEGYNLSCFGCRFMQLSIIFMAYREACR